MVTKKLGIIGGMGPEATVNMYAEIVKLTDACNDQEHLDILIHNNNKIPDRTEAILGNGNSPVQELTRSARILEKAGADMIIVPCITSHYFLKDIQDKVSVPFIDAIRETAILIYKKYKNINKVGVISTTGTAKSGLFQKAFMGNKIIAIFPSLDVQEEYVMKAIYGRDGIKAGNLGSATIKRIESAAKTLIADGAQAIIAGCTEIPLVLSEGAISVPLIDPIRILAKIAIKSCNAKVKDQY